MNPRLHRSSAVVVAALAFFAGCNENTVDPVFYGSLEGNVILKSSEAPAAGVEITTSPTTTTIMTDEAGNFSITDIPTGEYSIISTLEGYKKGSTRVIITRDHTTSTNIELEADHVSPNSAAVISPLPAAENIDRTVALKWAADEKNDEPLKFDVTLYESNQSAPLLQLKDFADTVVTVTDLKYNTTYFWQVNSKNGAGTVTYGELWHFKTLPFPDNRYLFASQRDGNYEIYSSDESGSNLVRLTHSDKDQVYPRYSHDRNLIAYTENTDLAYHLYIVNKDALSPIKVTSLPVAGYHNDGRGFCWSPDNGKLLYSHYDKLYTINRDGSNLTLIATAPAGRNFRACDWTGVNNRIVVETVGVLPYESEIRLIDLVDGTNVIIIPDEPGILQSPSFSVDGNNILFTRDVSGFESETGRQLDSRAFVYNIATGIRTEVSKDKLSGTNDLNPRYSPDGAKIILDNRSNDGSGLPSIFTFDITKNQRAKLFENACMPDFK